MDEVRTKLQNLAMPAQANKQPKPNKHPYRLVILNGCETYDAGWVNAFGIDYSMLGSTNIVLEYQFFGREPRAFVGWTAQIDVPRFAISVVHAQYALALSELFSKWMGGFPLDFCVDSFADSAIGYGFSLQDKWMISGCLDLRRND